MRNVAITRSRKLRVTALREGSINPAFLLARSEQLSRHLESPEVSDSNRRTTGLCSCFSRVNIFLGSFFFLEKNSLKMRGDETDSDSGKSDEGGSIERSFETLCLELNMDEETAKEAMQNFTSIWNTYTLEVRRLR